MTPRRISLRKCRRCVHHNPFCGCDYDYLENCHYVPRKDERVKDIYLAAVVFVGLLLSVLAFFYACTPATNATPPQEPCPPQSAIKLLRELHRDELSSWEQLQLAIIMTESRFDPGAQGANEDRGLYQITPIYVAEVNRLSGSHYVPTDAFDPGKSVEMFNTLQLFKNPDRDLDTAIRYHNKSAAYKSTVLANLEFVRRYEAARRAVSKQ